MGGMSDHTPGPWVVIFSKKNGAALRIEAPNDRDVAGAAGNVVRQNGIGIPACKIGRANARLIAAAPDFYHAATAGAQVNLPEFLEWVADRLVHVHGESPNVDFVLTCQDRAKLLRAAIAKAEGKAP